MRVKLISKPSEGYRDSKENMVSMKTLISKKIAKMVFEINPIFEKCWVSFFSGQINWFVDEPSTYYQNNSYFYIKGRVK